jgi:Fe-S-cluster-containing hydrogenase component 2
MGLFGLFKSTDGTVSEADLANQKIVVLKHRCPQNHPCPSVRVCPVGALTQRGYAAPVVDMDKCIKCGKCLRSCPMRALSMQS